MGEVGQEGEGVRYYFDDTSHMLLDVKRGVLKYDCDTHSLALVLPLGICVLRLQLCLLKHQDVDVRLAFLLKEVWQGCRVSDNVQPVTICKLQEVLLSLGSECRCLKSVADVGCVASLHNAGIFPVISLEFFLASLRWSFQSNTII
ncbi:hypothetical protein D3C85_1051460 [compost metagenome]